MAEWGTEERHPALSAFVAVGIPTGLIVAVAVWLGAAVIGALVSLLVMVAGVLLAASAVSLDIEHGIIRDGLGRDELLSREQARERGRRTQLRLGCAVTLAGGVGLAVSLAAW